MMSSPPISLSPFIGGSITREAVHDAFERFAAGQPLDETQRRVVTMVYGKHAGGAPRAVPEGVTQEFASPGHMLLASGLTLTMADGSVETSTDALFAVGNQTLSYAQVVTLAADYFAGTSLSGITQPICTAASSDQTAVFTDKFNSLLQQYTYVGGVENPVAALLQGVAAQTAVVQAGIQTFGANGTYLTYFQPYGDGGDSMADYFDYDVYGATVGIVGYGLISVYNFDHFGAGAQTAYSVGHAVAIQQAIAASSAPAPAAALLAAYMTNAFADHYLSDLFSSGHLRVPRQQLHALLIGVADFWSKDMHDEDSLLGLNVSNKAGDAWQAYGDLRDYDAVNTDNLDRARAALAFSIGEVYAAFQSGQAPNAYAGLAAAPDPTATMALANQPPMFRMQGGSVEVRQPVSSVATGVTYEELSSTNLPLLLAVQSELDGYQPYQMTWGLPVAIPGAENKYGGPALVTFKGALWAFWCQHTSSRGADNQIFFSSSPDGVTWTTATNLSSNIGTNNNPPALVAMGNLLYVFWVGIHYEAIYYSFSTDGIDWAQQSSIENSSSKYGGPVAAVMKGTLYVAWCQHTSSPGADASIWCASMTLLGGWSPSTQIAVASTNDNAPALCLFEDALWLAWTGYHDEGVWYSSTADGVNWTAQQMIADSETSVGPSLATFDGALYCAWVDGSSSVNYASWSGNDQEFAGAAGWGPPASLSIVSTDGNRPALVQFGQNFAVAWEGDDYDAVYVAIATIGLI